MNKLKFVSLAYAFIAINAAVCLFFVKGDVQLVQLGFFGSTENIAALLATALIPVLLCLFMFFFGKKKALCSVFSLCICAVCGMRIAAMINHLSYLKSQELLTAEKLVFYGVFAALILMLGVSFFMLSFSGLQSAGTTVLRVTAWVSVIGFGLFTLAFILAALLMSDERQYIRFFTTFSIVFLFDAVSSLLMLISVGGMRNVLYYQKQKENS